jgi:hypothetical protein
MTPKQFSKYLERDQGRCYHCGETEALSPNHRANRGIGGSKKRDHPANIVVLCSLVNGLIESDVGWLTLARKYGWKLSSWDDPFWVPVFDAVSGEWWLLDDQWGRTRFSRDHDPEDRPF